MRFQTPSLDYATICRQAIAQIAQAVQASSAQMYAWDAAAGTASVVAEYCGPGAAPRECRDELGVSYDLSEFPATLQHLVEKRPYIVHLDSPQADMADRARLAAADCKTALKIPMISHETVTGLVELYDSQPARDWSDQDIQVCQGLVSQAAVAIENARLQKIQRQQASLLTLLQNVTRRMAQVHHADQLIKIVVDAIAEVYACTIVDVMLLDENERELVMRAAAGSNVARTPINWRQSVEQGIIGRVVRAGSSYMSNNVRQDSFYFGWTGWPRGSELAAPIQRAGKTIGVLNLESESLGAFSSADVAVIEILAGQLAVALENADLYAQTSQRLNEIALLREIALGSAAATSVDALLRQATQVIAANLYSDNFGFLLFDEHSRLLRMHASYQGLGAEAMQITVPLEHSVTGQVVVTGEPILVADVRAHPNYFQLSSSTCSEMAAPLRVGGRIFGVLNVESRQAAAYAENDLRLLVTIADQLATAIERAQAQERAARSAAQLSVINEIGRRATAIPDAAALLRETAEALRQQLEYDYVLTALVNATAGVVTPVGYAGGRPVYPPDQPIHLKHAHKVLRQAATSGLVVHLPNVAQDPQYVPLAPDVKSELCLPICQPDQTVLGLVDIKSRQIAAFAPNDIEAMQILANQLAVALSNARLYAETQQRLRELSGLHELSQAFRLIADPGQLYEQITAQVARLLGVEQCSIVLHDPLSQTAQMQTPAYGLRPEQIARYKMLASHLPPDLPQCGYLLSNDPLQDAETGPAIVRELVIEMGERNLLVVPLLLGGRYIGTVRVANKVDKTPFTESDARLLTIFASQVAIAIENARILANSRRRAERLAALHNVSAALSVHLELETLMDALYQELGPLLKAEILAIYIPGSGEQQLECHCVDHGVYRALDVKMDAWSLAIQVIQTGQPLLVSDVTREYAALAPGDIMLGRESRSWLGTPLFAHTQGRGALALQAYAPGQFGEEELELVSQLAPQITLTIQNIRSSQQAQRLVAEFTTLQRVSMQLSAVLNPTEIMYAVIGGVQALTDAADVRIFGYEAGRERLTLTAARSHYKHKAWFDVPPRSDGLTATAARTGQPMIINAPDQSSLPTQSATECVLNAIASIPIKRGDHTLAVLNVAFAEQSHRFTQDNVRLLTMLADQAALALENAALFESERRQRIVADTLREMAAIVSASLELDEVLHRMLDQIRRVVEYDQGSVGLIAGETLVIQAKSGFADTPALLSQVPINALPLAQQIIATARPVLLADMQDPAAYPHDIIDSIGARQVRATMGIPIVSQNEVIGIVYLDSFTPNAFTPEHAHQVLAFTDHAALAIANARLYQALAGQRQKANAGQAR